MSHAPALTIRADRQGSWRLGVAALVALGAATTLAWWVSRGTHHGAGGSAALAACVLAIGCAAWGVRAGPATGLRWDAQRWWLDVGDRQPLAGDVSVAIDLGGWMLLRFVPHASLGRWQTRWVAVGRQGREGEWHALRCTVHAARADETPAARRPGT